MLSLYTNGHFRFVVDQLHPFRPATTASRLAHIPIRGYNLPQLFKHDRWTNDNTTQRRRRGAVAGHLPSSSSLSLAILSNWAVICRPMRWWCFGGAGARSYRANWRGLINISLVGHEFAIIIIININKIAIYYKLTAAYLPHWLPVYSCAAVPYCGMMWLMSSC